MTFSQKETTLLEDLKSHEELCVDKYAKYSAEACDPQLKDLFTQLGQKEQQHLDTINQIMSGNVPQMGGGNQQESQQKPTYQYQGNSADKPKDKYLCSDVLSTEKHVSSVYDTCIFEFKDTNVRNVLNHIQKEEQEHGEKIYDYMSQNGMYN